MKILIVVFLLLFCSFAMADTFSTFYVDDYSKIIDKEIVQIREYCINHNVTCSPGITACTAAYCGSGYYNEKGEWVNPEPCNTCTTDWECSDGKIFKIGKKQ